MARRGKSGFNLAALIPLIIIAVGILFAAKFLLQSKTDDYAGLSELSVGDYLENANSLRGNTYTITGIIDQRLDNWRAHEGRLFSIVVGEGTVAVQIPDSFNGRNIQRDQEYRFRVEVGEGGVLVAQEFDKT